MWVLRILTTVLPLQGPYPRSEVTHSSQPSLKAVSPSGLSPCPLLGTFLLLTNEEPTKCQPPATSHQPGNQPPFSTLLPIRASGVGGSELPTQTLLSSITLALQTESRVTSAAAAGLLL